jgi:hypothetical protein
MAALIQRDEIRPAQLRRLHALWREWTRPLDLEPDADRALRHYYVELFSSGQARETLELSRVEAAFVIAWFERMALASRARARANRAAGTAGRRGYPERRNVRPTRAAWRALWAHAAALGMTREQLDQFIARHYGAVGLADVRDIRSMADLNRVLWGLKAILRRKPPSAPGQREKAA